MSRDLLLLAGVLLLHLFGRSQTPGQIFSTATGSGAAAILDPNGDGYASVSPSGYNASVLANTYDESSNSEIPYVALFHTAVEPTADLQTGANCGATEIIDNPVNIKKSGFYYYHNPDNSTSPNGDEKLLFRMRLAKKASGNYGYSFLIDTDQKIGSGVDPNYVSGNPGFEVEVLYGSGNSGVQVYNVDGTASGTLLVQYTNEARAQKSYIYNTNCALSDQPFFLDFYIDYSTISALVGTNNLRISWATSSSSNSALGGSASDIGGYPYTSDDNAGFNAVVNGQSTPFSFSGGYALGVTFSQVETNCLDSQSKLYFSTLQEEDLVYFEIQKSVDLVNWSIEEILLPLGNTGRENDYQVNLDFGEGIRYYRIRALDLDGKSIYSETRSISCSTSELKIFPNPAKENIFVSHTRTVTSYVIVSSMGELVMQEATNDSNLTIPLNSIPTGIYQLQLMDEDGDQILRKICIVHN